MKIVDPQTVITPRQRELIALYASGYQLDEIARMKFLAYTSVRNTLALARERTGARNLAQLCVICVEHGVIQRNGHGYKPVQPDGVVAE